MTDPSDRANAGHPNATVSIFPRHTAPNGTPITPFKVGAGTDKFVVRLPDGLRGRIAAIAARSNRSMNAEIVQLLTTHLRKHDSLPSGLEQSVDLDPSLTAQFEEKLTVLPVAKKRALLSLLEFEQT